MATPRTVLWADSLNNRLVNGWRGLVFAQIKSFRRGDLVPITVRWVEPPQVAGGEMSEVVLPAGEAYSVYVGRRSERPFAGQYYVTYNGYDSPFIDWDAEQSVIQYELNKIIPVSNAGGVTVTQAQSDIVKITFNQKGARSAFTANGSALFPQSEGVFTVVQNGDANNYHVVAFKLRQLPIGQCTSFTQEPACTAAVEQVKQDVCDIYLTSDAKDGYFKVAIDAGSPVDVSVFEDYATLQQKIGAGYTVSRQGDFRWRIAKDDGSALSVSVVSSSDIVSFNGVQGTLVITNEESDEFLSGKAYAGAYLEIVRDNEDGSQMVCQVPCVVLNRVYQ